MQEEFQDTKGDESVNRRKTVNTMAKRKQAKGKKQRSANKITHKTKDRATLTTLIRWVNSCAPLVAHAVLL